MKVLLWKEFKERRWWAFCWAVVIFAVSLFGKGQPFCGEQPQPFLPWHILPLLLAVLVGIGGYASETARGRALFVFSRPIPWQQLLLAKLLFGGIIIVGVPLLAAITFWLTCPHFYREFATLPHLLAGVWVVAWKMGVLYLFGLSCSIVLNGMAGAMLTLVAVILVMVAVMLIPELITVMPMWGVGEKYYYLRLYSQYIGIIAGMWVATLCAGLPLAKYGPALEVSERVKRFAPVYVAILVGGWLVGLLLPISWANGLFMRWEAIGAKYNPTATRAYIIAAERFYLLGYRVPLEEYGWRRIRDFVIDTATGESSMTIPNTKFDNNSPSRFRAWRWINADTAYYYFGTQRLTVVHTDTGTVQIISGFNGYPVAPSPDGRYILMQEFLRVDNKGWSIRALSLIDLRTDRHLPPFIKGNVNIPHWLSNDTITYIDRQKRRYQVHISGKNIKYLGNIKRSKGT